MDQRAEVSSSPRSGQPPLPSLEELASQQGITPVEDFEALLGEPSPDDDSVEEFSAMLRAWRREGPREHDPR